jgi:predicted TIM-barrel fold metal-dependent hydrolase
MVFYEKSFIKSIMKQEIYKKAEEEKEIINSKTKTICSSTKNDRRSFIKKAFSGTLGVSGMLLNLSGRSAPQPIESSVPKMPVIDTHIHCFGGPNNNLFPYHDKASYKPETIASPEQLFICMNGAGVDFGVIVSPEPYQDDHRYLEYCLELGQGRLKGTILVFCDRPGSMDQLPRLAKRGDIIATRIHAYLPDRLPPFGKPELRQLWKLAADNGLAIQLNTLPRYAEGFEPLIKEFHNVPVIIDHLGHPLQARSAQEYSIVERWGDLPNTIIKLSELGVIYENPNPEIKSFVNQMITAYGLERMIWGGDFSNKPTPESYRATIDYARSFLGKFSKEDQENVFGGNASRLLCKGWK